MQINDRELLARTLQAEAGNQGLPGMIAAGSVVMNRIGSGGYGSNMRDVILKPGQFSAWNSMTGYAGGEQGQDMTSMTPSAEAYKAADMLLAGGYEDPTGGATHYYNPAISQPKWGAGAGGSWTEIGDHLFGRADAGRDPNQGVAADAMRAIGRQPRGILAPQATEQTETENMIPQDKPRGLLGSLGIQKMEEGAEGETGQRFYQRDTFKDTAATLAQGFAAMGSNPGLQKFAADVAAQRTENKARNKTLEYLSKMPNGEELVKLAEIAGPAAVVQQVVAQRFAKPKEKVRQVRGSEIGLTGPQAERLFNVDADNKVTAIGGTAPVTNINMGDELSPGLKKLDESFAGTYANLSMSGLADARSQAATISTVLEKLEAGEQLTGPLIGAQPDFLLAITNPDAQDAIDRVGSVVQRSLREVLGGQFAQKEGEQLVRRAYNPSLPPAQNAARLRALFAMLDQTAKNKMDMATYYQDNNYSLGGYKGNLGLPSADDLYAAMDAAAPAPATGTSQLSAEDQALVDKYLTPKDGG